MEVRRTTGADPVARELVTAMMAEVEVCEPGMPAGPSTTPRELSPPHGGFLLLYDGDRAVAGGGVKRLDTGPEQPGAQRLYERAGYVGVPDYNGNPYASFWGEKRLSAPAPGS